MANLEKIAAKQPDVVGALVNLKDKVFVDGALSVKNKALMALAIGTVLKCNTCLDVNYKLAIDSGATVDEIRESLVVAMYMAGPSAVVWSAKIGEIMS